MDRTNLQSIDSLTQGILSNAHRQHTLELSLERRLKELEEIERNCFAIQEIVREEMKK